MPIYIAGGWNIAGGWSIQGGPPPGSEIITLVDGFNITTLSGLLLITI
jgi:hypothetical protein